MKIPINITKTQVMGRITQINRDADGDRLDGQPRCLKVVANLLYQCLILMNRPNLSNNANLKFIYDELMIFSKTHETVAVFSEEEFQKKMVSIFSHAHLLSAFEMATFWYHVNGTSASVIAENFPGGKNFTVVSQPPAEDAERGPPISLYPDFATVLREMEIRKKLDTFFVMEKLMRELHTDWFLRLHECNAICCDNYNPWLPSRARVRIYFPTEEDLILGHLYL